MATQSFRFGFVGVLGLALLGSVPGCGAAPDGGEWAHAGYDVGSTSEAITQVCGANKYNGPQGADVSSWQGNFVWTGKGLKFGYGRISDGTGYVDAYFTHNWTAMKSAGILRGAYQYFEPGQDATAQANMMVSKVGGMLGAGDMPCMIDVEAPNPGVSAATYASKIQTWLDIVEKGTGKRPVIYTGAYYWEQYVKSTAFSKYPLWIAAYGPTCPSVPNGWSNWKIWQYCDGQTKYCTNGSGFDRDVFNGTQTDLQNFANANVGPVWGAQYVNQSFPLATTTLEMTACQTIPSYITLKNVGTTTWDSKTRLGTTQPRDRSSVFADSSWIAPNRPAGVSGTIAPGGQYKFQFNLHAPATAGSYDEFFGVVEEGVTWFSAAGQGGPPDNQLEVKIHVSGSGPCTTGSGGSGGSGGGAGATGAAGTTGSGGASGSAGTTGSAGASAGGSSGAGGNAGSAPGTGGGAGSSSDAGTAQPPSAASGGDSGGCGCRLGASPASGAGASLSLLFALGFVVRRRRRR